MEEKIKLLEAQVMVLQNTVNKMDQILGVLLGWFSVNKQMMDTITIQKPAVPVEEKK